MDRYRQRRTREREMETALVGVCAHACEQMRVGGWGVGSTSTCSQGQLGCAGPITIPPTAPSSLILSSLITLP